MNVTKLCPMCGEGNVISVDVVDYNKYCNGTLLQNAFPKLNPMEREFVKSGYCPNCQRLLFGSDYASELIKNV